MSRTVELIIGRHISLNLDTITRDFASKIRNRLTIDNPVYLKNKKMGFWTGNIPKKIKFWKNYNNWLILPRGFRNSLLKELRNSDLIYKIKDLRVINKPIKCNSSIKLRNYQIPAVERAIKLEQGIIEAPCDQGKLL